MKKRLLFSSLAAASLLFASDSVMVEEGWQLLGTSSGIENMEVFDKPSIRTVWTYDKSSQSWKVYSPDENINALVDANPLISTLETINPNEGFWVNVNDGYMDSLEFDNDFSEDNETDVNDTVVVQDKFVDKLIDVNISDLAGRTFKFVRNNYKESNSLTIPDLEYTYITFDNDGVAEDEVQLTACTYNHDQNKSSVKITAKLEDGMLNFYLDDNATTMRSYKKLASDETGIVFGTVDDSEDFSYMYEASLLPGSVFYFLDDDAVATPEDMNESLPLGVYYPWSSDYYRVYESNGTVSYYYNSQLDTYNNESFFINEDNAIESSYHYNNDNNYNKQTFQNIYNIGRYIIADGTYQSKYSREVIGYYDANNTWTDLNLTANSDIDTWTELFEATDYKMYSTKYYDINKTTSNNEVYTISEDGKVLTVENEDGCYKNIRIIENGEVVSAWADHWLMLYSTTPVVNTKTSSVALDRKLSKKNVLTQEEVEKQLQDMISKTSWIK